MILVHEMSGLTHRAHLFDDFLLSEPCLSRVHAILFASNLLQLSASAFRSVFTKQLAL
jgi:hypothetical protein